MILEHNQNQIGGVDSDTYLCPHCHANILKSNEITHDIACARNRRNQATANTNTNTNADTNTNARNTNVMDIEPAQTRPLIAQRQNSSSGNIYPELDGPYRQQPQPRRREIREERKVDNKLMTCPNCEKSVREQDFNVHLNYECQGSDKIPCEFCNQPFPMSTYSQHVEHCPARQQEQSNNNQQQQQRQQQEQQHQHTRPTSPGRDVIRAQQREQHPRPSSLEERRTQPSHNEPNARDVSPRRGASQEQKPGGFMDFIYNIGSAAANALKNYATHEGTGTDVNGHEQQRRQQQAREQQAREQQAREQARRQQEHQPGFFERLLGVDQHEPSRTTNRNTVPQRQTRPSNTFMDMFNPFVDPRQQQMHQEHQPSRERSGGTLVRTVERGPHGTLIVRTRVVPTERARAMQMQQRQPQMSRGMEEMGPLGLLLSLLNDGHPGMPTALGGVQDMTQEEKRGIDQNTLNDMAVVKFDKEKFKNLDVEARTCPICLDEFQDGDNLKFLWCLHRFHQKCVDHWLEKNTNCPVCKKDFSEAENFEQS